MSMLLILMIIMSIRMIAILLLVLAPLILGFWFRPLGPGPLAQALWSWAFTRKMVGDQDSVNVEPKET